jgi:hypothetical protein
MVDKIPKEPTLKLNKETGYYEGLRCELIQVEAELFRRVLLKIVEEDSLADLTDPTTWAQAASKIGKIAYWYDKPHTRITPVEAGIPVSVPEVQPKEQENPETKPTRATQVFLSDLEAELEEQAKHLPPYQWEEKLLSPLGPVAHLHKHDLEKQRVYQLRFKQGRILKALYTAWEQGEFILDTEAMNKQQAHALQAETKLETKLETVALAVNGSRFH